MTKSKTPQPAQNPNSEATNKELLEFMVILYQISLNQSVVELNKFTVVVSRILGEEEFRRLLKGTIQMMGNKKCGDQQCSDWLMTKLFDLYTAFGS